MNLRFLWLDHFPAGLDLTPAQQRQARKWAREHRQREWNYRGSHRAVKRFLLYAVGALSLAFAIWIVALVGMKLRVAGFVVANVTGILLFQALIWTCIAYGIHRSNVPYIRKALCDMEIPVCMECGYILRGLNEHERRCPECGAQREPMSR